MDLPKQIDVPPQQKIGIPSREGYDWKILTASARAAGIRVSIDERLKEPCWGAFEIRIDGRLGAYDYSDFLQVDAASWRYPFWLKRNFCAGHTVRPTLISLAPSSFASWERYHAFVRSNQYTAAGNAVLHKQAIHRPQNHVGVDLYRRRTKARRILVKAFGERVDTLVEPQQKFFEKAFGSLVSVHIPGSWAHLLDRGQHQLMGLGICTISPDLWTCCAGERPQPCLHYVPIRDDFSDLVERVEWCDRNRDECRQIGQRAKAFFASHSKPEPVWRHIQQRLSA